jgi:hypothetical protein
VRLANDTAVIIPVLTTTHHTPELICFPPDACLNTAKAIRAKTTSGDLPVKNEINNEKVIIAAAFIINAMENLSTFMDEGCSGTTDFIFLAIKKAAESIILQTFL